jgi:hypothetical protein
VKNVVQSGECHRKLEVEVRSRLKRVSRSWTLIPRLALGGAVDAVKDKVLVLLVVSAGFVSVLNDDM